jgi:hypothetical protein
VVRTDVRHVPASWLIIFPLGVHVRAARRRLARGVVTGAIPEDLAREEQDRITKELGQAHEPWATLLAEDFRRTWRQRPTTQRTATVILSVEVRE